MKAIYCVAAVLLIMVVIFIIRFGFGTGGINEPFAAGGTKEGAAEWKAMFTTSMSDPFMKNPISYRTVNEQQYIYFELINLFKQFSGGEQRSLDKTAGTVDYELYKPETITHEVISELNEITDKVMEQLRQKSQYALVRNAHNTYDHVRVWHDTVSGATQFVYDVFVQDPVNGFQLRLQVDVIKYVDVSAYQERESRLAGIGMGSCAAATTPVFPTYPGGYPKHRQEIPLPTQVIPTGLQLIGLAGINIKDPLPIVGLHINGVRIYNNNWILGADKICDLEAFTNITGTNYTTLDADKCIGGVKKDGGCQEPAALRNPWIPVPGENLFPHYDGVCDTSIYRWDSKGVQYTPPVPCTGMRDPRVQQPFTVEYNPTVATIPRWQGDNSWMFDLARGDPQNHSGA